MRFFKNQRGLAFFEVILAIIVLAIIAFIGYRYWSARQTKPGGRAGNQSQPTQTDPYAGWKTYTSAKENLTFKYPADWTLNVDQTADSDGKPHEKATLIGTNSFQFKFIVFDASAGIGGGCETCGVYESTPLTIPNYGVQDTQIVIAGSDYAGQTAGNIGIDNIATGPGLAFMFIKAKKLGSGYMMQFSGSFVDGNGDTTQIPYNMFKDKSEVKTARLILQSVSY